MLTHYFLESMDTYSTKPPKGMTGEKLAAILTALIKNGEVEIIWNKIDEEINFRSTPTGKTSGKV